MMMDFQYRTMVLISVLTIGLSACGGARIVAEYPEKNDSGTRNSGSVIDNFRQEGGGLGLNLGSRQTPAATAGLNSNADLWHAALDTLAFMPLASADPASGVIITDWYEDPQKRGTRFKINVLILGTELRADSLRVAVFREAQEGGAWRGANASAALPRQLENIILTRARDFKLRRTAK